MSSATLYRWSGIALLVGGALAVVSSILDAVLFPGHNATSEQILSAPWVIGEVLFLVGILLIAMGFPGSYLRQAARAGRLGYVGFVLLWLGALLGGVGFSAVRITIFPYLAQSAPTLIAGNPPVAALLLLILGPGLLLDIGTILLGIATMRARVFSRWAGILLLAAGIINIITLPLPPSMGNLVEPIGEVALFLAFAWFGYTLVAQGKETVTTPAPAMPAAHLS